MTKKIALSGLELFKWNNRKISKDVLLEHVYELAKEVQRLNKLPTEHLVRMINQDLRIPARVAKAQADIDSARGKNAINARHDLPNGSRDTTNKMRAIWKTGKYSSRDICAEQECAGLGISFSKARKALRNTPSNT